jgi:hypothetical protein
MSVRATLRSRRPGSCRCGATSRLRRGLSCAAGRAVGSATSGRWRRADCSLRGDEGRKSRRDSAGKPKINCSDRTTHGDGPRSKEPSVRLMRRMCFDLIPINLASAQGWRMFVTSSSNRRKPLHAYSSASRHSLNLSARLEAFTILESCDHVASTARVDFQIHALLTASPWNIRLTHVRSETSFRRLTAYSRPG